MIHIAKSAANRARARLKQLCCLGIGAEMIMPALFEELRQIIPSVTSTFFFADEQGQLARIYDDAPESPVMAQLYVDEFHNRPDRLLPGFDFAEAMRTQSGVFDVETQHHIGLSEFRGTEFYNTFYRAHGWDSFVRLVVREPGRRLGLGRLTLHRGPGEQPCTFRDRERRDLMGQVDDLRIRCDAHHHTLADRHRVVDGTEIGQEDDQRAMGVRSSRGWRDGRHDPER